MDVLTVVVSILGGSAFGGLLGWLQASGLRRTTRRGRARLVHEDLYRFQSTVARMYFQSTAEGEWGDEAWMLKPLAEKEDQQDVLAHLGDWRFGVCAGALGWAEYLRGGRGHSGAPNDDELVQIYERLAWGRLAVSKMRFSGFEYVPHDAELVVGDRKDRNQEGRLPPIPPQEAERAAKAYRRSDDTGLRSRPRP